MDSGTRGALLDRLAEAIGSVPAAHPVRVAVDGPPAAGKSSLADELALVLRAAGRTVIRATCDSFMFPRAVRYRRGKESPDACYRDSFDYDALRRVLLDPLGPAGDRRYQHTVYDWHADRAVAEPPETAAGDAVLLVDGVFLQRRELIDCWELRIYLAVSSKTMVDRGRARDLARGKPAAEAERRFQLRYIPAQRLYLAEAQPIEQADVVVHNDEIQRPAWKFRRPRPAAGLGQLPTVDGAGAAEAAYWLGGRGRP
jgi:uridine kinase